jgi:MarR family transcriptional regulator, organic hydroperoxide resistance regulator
MRSAQEPASTTAADPVVANALAESIVHRYLTLVRYQRFMSELVRRTANISGRQLSVLHHLVDVGPRTVGQIGQFLYVRDATVSPLLERMERDGYVTRRRCLEDNRKVLVELTDLGREVVEHAPHSMVWHLRVSLPELPIDDLQALDDALQRLSEVAQVDESILE